jgi:hypothetical protein
MVRSRALGVIYFIGAAFAGIPGAFLVGAVVLYNFVYEAEACTSVQWCDNNAYGLLGFGLFAIALWLYRRGMDQWRGEGGGQYE